MPGLHARAGDGLTLEALDADPHAAWAALRARAPAAWVAPLGGWVVLRRETALAVMRDTATFTVDDPRFTTARVVGRSMLSTDGDEHARHRAPWARPFRLDAVRERFTAVVAAETDRLIDAFAADGAADLRTAFAGPLAAIVVTAALGLEAAGADRVLGWYRAIVDAVTALTSGRPLPPAGPAAFAELGAAVTDALGPVEGLSPEEAVSDAAILLFGGIETTEGMIANAIRHLLLHPDQLALVRADPALAAAAVEESLRLEPAAATVDRYATADVRLGDAEIARGDLVIVSIAAANRDPDAFPDPDAFDLHRPNAGRHLAFAAGPHVCIGMHLARLEAHTAVRRVLERLPGLELADPAGSAPRGLVFRKPPALRVRWQA